jgi:hypothetical protein
VRLLVSQGKIRKTGGKYSAVLKAKENPKKKAKKMYELFYASGGHGGPYHSITAARKAAKAWIQGIRKSKPFETVSIMEYVKGGWKEVELLPKKPIDHTLFGAFPRGNPRKKATKKKGSLVRKSKSGIERHKTGLGEFDIYKQAGKGKLPWILMMIKPEYRVVRAFATKKEAVDAIQAPMANPKKSGKSYQQKRAEERFMASAKKAAKKIAARSKARKKAKKDTSFYQYTTSRGTFNVFKENYKNAKAWMVWMIEPGNKFIGGFPRKKDALKAIGK